MTRPKEFDYNEKLEVARNVFWRKGYNATSMNDLVEHMQINRSSLYLTYGNKHDLFMKSLENYMEMKNRQYETATKKGKTPLDSIKNIIKSVYQSTLLERNCLFTNSVFELALTDKKVAQLVKRENEKAAGIFEQLLKQAKEDGTVSKELDPMAHAHFLVSGLVSIYNTHIVFNNEKLTKQTMDLLIGSVN